MTTDPKSLDERVAELEAKVQELDAMVALTLRLLAVAEPVSSLLTQFGATDAEDRTVHALLDDMTKRMHGHPNLRPSIPGFAQLLWDAFPAQRDNREFLTLLVDALRIDRPAYRALHTFLTAGPPL